MISGRDEEKLKKKAAELKLAGPGQAAYHTANITNVKDIKQLVAKTVEIFDGIHKLVKQCWWSASGLI